MRVVATKEQMGMCGVYCILNVANGRRYIGSAGRSFQCRFENHRKTLRKCSHHSPLLQMAWNKYGEDSFEFRILEITAPEHAVAVEQVFIDCWRTADREHGYNILPTAGSWLGKRHSPESIAKMSAAQSGRPATSDETKAKLSAAGRGRPHTPEHRANIAAANKGKRQSAEHRAKLGLIRRGRTYRPDTIERMRAASLGKTHSAETKAKIGAAHRGKTISELAKQRCRETLLRKKLLKASSVLEIIQ